MESRSRAPLPPPKTSIFDLTRPGLGNEDPVDGPGAPKSLPGVRPSGFDATLTQVPGPSTRRSIQAMIGAVLGRAKQLEAPGAGFGSSLLETPPMAPVASCPPRMQSDEVAWDEGTAAEWNPRWNQATAPAAESKPSSLLGSGWRYPLVLAALGFVAVLVAFAVLPARRLPAENALRPQPIPAALQSYLAKAEAGDASAMRMLGLCYCYGVAAPADWTTGVAWLRRAAKAGNATALKELRSMGIRAD